MSVERAVRDGATVVVAGGASLGVSLSWIDIVQYGYSAFMAAVALFIAVGRAALLVREWRQGSKKATN